MDVRFLGHACFELSDGAGTNVLIDPFLTGNPKAAVAADELNPTTILLSHGHVDHVGDTIGIATRTGVEVVATTELAGELGEDGVTTRDTNLGGTEEFEWGSVKLVPALHDSRTPKGGSNLPAGLVIDFKGTVIYHLGDTALFSDLSLVGRRRPVDIAIIPIGGHYTMDRHDAVDAADFVGAKTIIPCHYDTFPAIETDAGAFQTDIEKTLDAICVVLEPGAVHEA
jgi:L-ascorbate metabolism protein UlaG (beta-lactamase superfamily)